MFIEQAYKGDNDPFKVITILVLTMGVFVVNLFAFLFGAIDVEATMDTAYAGRSNNMMLAIQLSVFVFLLLVLFGLVRLLHQRSILSMTTARSKVDGSRILFSFSLVSFFTLLSLVISIYLSPENIVFNFKPIPFIGLLFISLLMFPFQIGLEEYLFRGYFMQQVGIVAKNRWIPLVLSSVLFGVFHAANPEVAKIGWWIMIYYIGTGLLLGVMTLMDDGIELALGFHLANNLWAALLVSYDFAALRTDALFRSTADSIQLWEVLTPVFILYPILLFVFFKKYHWTHWREKLTGRVAPSVD